MTCAKNITWFMYILCCRDQSYYCGITTDLIRRVDEHNKNKKKASKYVWSRRPGILFYYEKYCTRSDALKAEAAFKKKNKKQKLDYMVQKTTSRTLV